MAFWFIMLGSNLLLPVILSQAQDDRFLRICRERCPQRSAIAPVNTARS